MSFFKRIFGALMGGGGNRQADSAGGNAYWIYVQCAACGEKIRVRVNREHDLSPEFEGESDTPTGYHVAKEIVGQSCFRRIHVEMTFDRDRHLAEQQITGGQFITREEFEAAEPAGA